MFFNKKYYPIFQIEMDTAKTIGSVETIKPEAKDDPISQAVLRLTSKINYPQACETMIDMIKIVDPEFDCVAKIKDINFQAALINMLPQEDFNCAMTKHRKCLSYQTLNLLSIDKLQLWYTPETSKIVLCDEFNVINMLVARNLMPESYRKHLLDSFMGSGCGKNTSTTGHYETLELILMTYGETIEIDLSHATDIKILQIVGKYLLNKNKMLSMECDVKDKCIADLEAKLSAQN
jgi:hypothetical protein